MAGISLAKRISERSLSNVLSRRVSGEIPKGCISRLAGGEILEFTGVSDPYEMTVNPELIVRTETESVEEAAERIILDLKLSEFL